MQLVNYIETKKQARAHCASKTLLMTHVICGYPSFEENWAALEVMESADVELVELQFPFSEPSADGPLFVQANQVAVASGVSTKDCFEFMRKVTQRFHFKVLMMGYYNTMFKYGHEAFLRNLQKAGACGYIVPDLPIEESQEIYALSQQLNLSPIVLMTPTSSDARLQTIAENANGFVYVVARKGVTGKQTNVDNDVVSFLARCRAATSIPLAVGFGISSKSDIDTVGTQADIAVIGTAALKVWLSDGADGLKQFLVKLRENSRAGK